MTLEQHVISLELAKKLKELGVKQESVFAWFRNDGMSEWELDRYQDDWPKDEWPANDIRQYSVFTVTELGEILSPHFSSHKCIGQPQQWECCNDKLEWHCDPKKGIYREAMHAESEADARAKMLIYLLENNLYDPAAA